MKILEEQAEKGSPETQLALGLMLYSGTQVPEAAIIIKIVCIIIETYDI